MSRKETEQIRQARTCYGHLAGVLGVSVTEAFLEQGLLVQEGTEFRVTEKGEEWFGEFGLDLPELRRKRRRFAPVCMDGTERRPHIAGALGDAIAFRFFELKWVERLEGTRGVQITQLGMESMKEQLGIEVREAV
ncbi:MAG TPA: hypothetical protein VFV52_08430 [Bacilli bacterium]|nr:hypothetical protein [Bacilli bacterium]